MIFIEIGDYYWGQKDIHDVYSDMLKVIGILDYFLSKKLNERHKTK